MPAQMKWPITSSVALVKYQERTLVSQTWQIAENHFSGFGHNVCSRSLHLEGIKNEGLTITNEGKDELGFNLGWEHLDGGMKWHFPSTESSSGESSACIRKHPAPRRVCIKQLKQVHSFEARLAHHQQCNLQLAKCRSLLRSSSTRKDWKTFVCQICIGKWSASNKWHICTYRLQ